MAIDMKKEFSRLHVITTNAHRPPRIVLHGTSGVGKTTFAASAEKPIFILTEDGLGKLEVDHFPMVTGFEQLIEYMESLAAEAHDYKTVVLDSLDWLETLIWDRVAKDNGKSSIEDIGYAKGYIFALNYWRELLRGFTYLRDEKNMTVVLLAHSQIKRFDSPTSEPYDRIRLKLHDKAAAVVAEWSDVILYAGYRAVVKRTDDQGKHVIGIGKGERVLYTEERPAFDAKNRYGLPPELPFTWQAFREAMGT